MRDMYYVWADGVEQGPMSLQHLMREWRSGSLPKGFLWRRESDDIYQSPEGLVEEEKPKEVPPIVPKPLPVEKIPVFRPSDFTMFIAIVIFIGGFLVSIFSAAFGGEMISLAITIIISSYAVSVLRALNEIVRKLHEIAQRGKEMGQ